MTGHRGYGFGLLLLVLALIAMTGCQKKTPEASKGVKGAAATAEAMPAVAPEMAPDMAVEPMVAPAPDAAVKKRPWGLYRKGSKEYNEKGPRDHLRSGVGGPSLADAASSASRPRSGGHHPRGRPAPHPVVPTSHISVYVPPVPAAGSAAARVRAKIRARVYSLRICHKREMIKNPKAFGTAKIRFTIPPNGRVNSVSVTGTPSSLIACIKGKVKRWLLGQVPKAVPYGPFTVRFTVKKK